MAATLLMVAPLSLFGAGSDFTIGLTVIDNDANPPTVPGAPSAVGISASEVVVSWAASADDVAVSGYVVRRDGASIATTTLLSYTDSGLLASTTYAYTIEAFDGSFNYSGQTAPVDGTTLLSSGGGGGPIDSTPPIITGLTPESGATGVATGTALTITFSEMIRKVGGDVRVRRVDDQSIIESIAVNSAAITIAGSASTIVLGVVLDDDTEYFVEIDAGAYDDAAGNLFAGITDQSTWSFRTIDRTAPSILGLGTAPGMTSATTTFNSDEPGVATLEWGTSTEYSLGIASELVYTLSHLFVMSGLQPDTQYFIRVTLADASSNVTSQTSSFTTSAPPPPPDTTPPANPDEFRGVPGVGSIALAWQNPIDLDLDIIRVMRGAGAYPADPNDGILVYEGVGTAHLDSGLAEGVRYYYTAFSRDLAGNYSSGAIHSTTTLAAPPPPPPPPVGEEEPPPVGEEPPPPPPSSGGSTTTPPIEIAPIIIPPITATSSGPFLDFPATATPSTSLRALSLDDFLFFEIGEEERQLVVRREVIRVVEGRNVRVSIAYDRLPEVLKTVAISIAAPGGGDGDSYLLTITPTKDRYEAIIPGFAVAGDHPFLISVLDQEQGGAVRIPGEFRVSADAPSPIQEVVEEIVTQVGNVIERPVEAITPIAAPVGVAIGASQAVLLATNVTSLYDLYLLFLKLIALITGLFRRRRNEPWGVVYDSVTKRPLDPAYVVAQVRGTESSKGEAITDLDGRYGFMLDPGEYIIVANKTHYRFPSESLKGRNRDELYENLYFGDPFRVREGGVVQYNIPLDPVEFDWNEFAKNQDKVFKVYSKKNAVRAWIMGIIFYAGLAFSLATLALAPSVLNAIIVAVYAIILAFQVLWRATHRVTRVVTSDGRVLPFSIIKVWMAGLNTIVKKTVSDEMGRYYFLVPPGRYYVTVEEKRMDGSYREVLRTGVFDLKKGVLREDLVV
jgi:chitodextrinase